MEGNSALAVVTEVDRRLAEATVPEQANLLRRQIAAVQKFVTRRREAYPIALEAATAYLKASIKAGELWAASENKRGRGQQIARNGDLVSATEAGFSSHQDASRCIGLSRLGSEDVQAYLAECRRHSDLPTLGGALAIKAPSVTAAGIQISRAFRDHSGGEDCDFRGTPLCWHPRHAHHHRPLPDPRIQFIDWGVRLGEARGWDEVVDAAGEVIERLITRLGRKGRVTATAVPSGAGVSVAKAAETSRPTPTTAATADGVADAASSRSDEVAERQW